MEIIAHSRGTEMATSWSGPGAIVGAGGGAVIGGAIGGGIDWAFGLSDKAA